MPEIVVVASIKAKPDQVEAAKEALLGVVAPTHADDGNILYALHQAAEDPTRFAFVERWQSPEQLETHMATEHLQTLLGRIPELLAEAPDIVVYLPLPAGEETKGSLAGHAA